MKPLAACGGRGFRYGFAIDFRLGTLVKSGFAEKSSDATMFP
jgi:hypothetical protein